MHALVPSSLVGTNPSYNAPFMIGKIIGKKRWKCVDFVCVLEFHNNAGRDASYVEQATLHLNLLSLIRRI